MTSRGRKGGPGEQRDCSPTATRFRDGADARRVASRYQRLGTSPPSASAAQVAPGLDAGPAGANVGALSRPWAHLARVPLRNVPRSLAASVGHLLSAVASRVAPEPTRRWQRHQPIEVDDFGFDARKAKVWQPWLRMIYEKYWRTTTLGLEHLPDRGPTLVCVNRTQTPVRDAIVLQCTLMYDHAAQRHARPLLESTCLHQSLWGISTRHLGCVRSTPDNARTLLEREHLVIASTPLDSTGDLHAFGQLVSLAVRLQAPIVPCAISHGKVSSAIALRRLLLGQTQAATTTPAEEAIRIRMGAGLRPRGEPIRKLALQVVAKIDALACQ